MKGHAMKSNGILTDLVFYAIILMVAYGLKYHYSHVDSDELVWILAPTAGLVEMMSPLDFESEKGQGFFCREQGVIIAPACAGVNFMIISFCMTAFYGMYQLHQKAGKVSWLLISLAGAFALTIFVNAVRIILSVYLYKSGIHVGWFTVSRIHLTAGVLIYVVCLYGNYLSIPYIMRWIGIGCDRHKEAYDNVSQLLIQKVSTTKVLVPMAWYGLITLGVPFLNHGYARAGNRFLEHAAMVSCICLGICLIISCIRLFYLKLKGKVTTELA